MYGKTKIQIINEIPDEKSLREKVLMILLQKMGYSGVTLTHGADESGKDLVFYEIDGKTNLKTYYAVVAKMGRLKAGSNKDNDNIINIHNQVKKAFTIPYEDINTKQEVYINHVWVVNNESCSAKARKEIVALFGKEQATLFGRNVTFIEETMLCDLLSKFWPEFFAIDEPFIFEYCSRVKDQFILLDELKSLGYSKEIKKVLDIYVEPTMIEEKKGDDPRDTMKPIQHKVYTSETLLSSPDHIWLDGQAGSGKTTIIKKMVLKLLDNLSLECAIPQVPCVLNFKDMCDDDHVIPIEECMKSKLAEFNTYNMEIHLEDWLSGGKCILFLDGFDEIPTDQLKEQMLRGLKSFSLEHSKVKIICASRSVEIEMLMELKYFARIHIYPLNYKQIMRFLDRWFRDKDNVKSEMFEALRKTALAGKLPKTPMVITLLAILFEEKPIKELPANLTELYTMFTELYLGRWDIQRGVNTLFDYNLKDNLLLNLAYEMHEKGIDALPESVLIDYINKYAHDRRIIIDHEKFIGEVVGRSQLLYKDPKGSFAFKHFSFQEYLASKKLSQIADGKDHLIEIVLNLWWENVVFFYVGSKKEAPEILTAIMEETVPKTFEERMRKCLNAGQLLQAAYLTKHETKVAILKRAINEYSALYPELCDAIKKIRKLEKKNSKFLAVIAMQYLFKNNYNSSTLINSMQQVFEELHAMEKMLSFDHLLKLTLLAYTLGTLQIKEPLESIASNPSILDPEILFLVNLNLSDVQSEFGVKFSQVAIRKVKKRIEKSGIPKLPYKKIERQLIK